MLDFNITPNANINPSEYEDIARSEDIDVSFKIEDYRSRSFGSSVISETEMESSGPDMRIPDSWRKYEKPERKEPGNDKDWKPCTSPQHNFPSMLYIPAGSSFTHVCPNCGYTVTVRGRDITC